MDPRDGTRRPPPADARWAQTRDAASSSLPKRDRTILGLWLERWRDDPADHARPWERPGWRQRAIARVDATLAGRGLGRTGAVEQVRAWETSAVLRLETPGGAFYLKSVPRHFERELRLTAALASEHPRSIPPLVAIDLNERWLLYEASVHPPLDEVIDLAAWERAAARYGALQAAWAERADALLGLGLEDRRLGRLGGQIAACLADERAMLAGEADGLTADEMARLPALAREAPALCTALASLGIADALDHGDLWGSNVLAAPEPLFIDWEDASVSHPFFSVFLLALGSEERFPEPAAAAAAVRDAYLTAWAGRAPDDGLRAVFALNLAQQVAPLRYAVSFRDVLAATPRPSWELLGFVPYFVRLALQRWGRPAE